MRLDIPAPLRLEHEQLHATLVDATREPGAVGAAAKEVARLLHPHFAREEEFALPPLALLSALASGVVQPEMAQALPMTQRLEAELAAMRSEHATIVVALDRLARAAREAGLAKYESFAKALELHARTEEQVLYPAAILVGRYVSRALADTANAMPGPQGAGGERRRPMSAC